MPSIPFNTPEDRRAILQAAAIILAGELSRTNAAGLTFTDRSADAVRVATHMFEQINQR